MDCGLLGNSTSAGFFGLLIRAQVNHDAEANLIPQFFKIGGRQMLQTIGAEDEAAAETPTPGREIASQIAEVETTLEVDPRERRTSRRTSWKNSAKRSSFAKGSSLRK